MSTTSLGSAENHLTVAIDVLEDLATFLGKHNIHVLPESPQGQDAFLKLPFERQLKIVEEYKAYVNLIRPELGVVHPLSVNQEKDLVRKSLKQYNLRHTEGSEEAIETGYLIEVYDLNAIQLYRNLEFFRHCGYSLLELASTEWFNLYHRPQQVTEALMEEIGRKVFTEGVAIRPKVPAHILRETRSNRKKAFLVQVEAIFPLRDANTNQVAAMLTKIKAELIAEGDEADKIGIA